MTTVGVKSSGFDFQNLESTRILNQTLPSWILKFGIICVCVICFVVSDSLQPHGL